MTLCVVASEPLRPGKLEPLKRNSEAVGCVHAQECAIDLGNDTLSVMICVKIRSNIPTT